jgi:hypothetical protein
MAGPKYYRSKDRRFFAPLADLAIDDTRPFLGIVHPLDGVEGLKMRYATAKQFLDDFGVAMYCGFGRQPGRDGARDHARAPGHCLGRHPLGRPKRSPRDDRRWYVCRSARPRSVIVKIDQSAR